MADNIVAIYSVEDICASLPDFVSIVVNNGGAVIDAYREKYQHMHVSQIVGSNFTDVPTIDQDRAKALSKMSCIEEAVKKVFGLDCYAKAFAIKACRQPERLCIICNLKSPEEFYGVRRIVKNAGLNVELWCVDTPESKDPAANPIYRKTKSGYAKAVKFDRVFEVDSINSGEFISQVHSAVLSVLASGNSDMDDSAYEVLRRTHPDMVDMPPSYVIKM